MGVTKILSIKHQLSARLNYVTNSKKTHLATDITYITNPRASRRGNVRSSGSAPGPGGKLG